MKARILFLAACAILCVLAACPAQAQTPLNERVAVAVEAVAEADEAEAAAWEAGILTSIAWAAIGESEADNLGARELASRLRNKASEGRQLASEIRRNASAAQEVSSWARGAAPGAREAASRLRNKALTARELASEAEGNMMKAQANATGRYAALWERAAAAGVERTAWVRVVSRRDAAARAWDATAKALEAAADTYGVE